MNVPVLVLLGFSHLITDLTQGILPLLLDRLKDSFHLSYTAVGVIVMMANLSSSVVQPIFGYLTDKRPRPWLMPAGILLTGLGMAAIAFVPNYWMLLLVVLVSGLGTAAFHPEASKTAHFASGKRKASSMAVFSLGGNLGIGLGPLLALFLLRLGGLHGIAGALVLPGLMALLVWRYLPAMPRSVYAVAGGGGDITAEAPPSTRRKLVALALLVGFVTVRSWVHAGMVNYIALYQISYLGGSESFAATLITTFLVAGAFGTIVGGPLADRLGPRRLILLSMVVTLPLIYWFRHSSGPWTVIPVALSGAGIISTFAPAIVLGQSLLPRNVGVASGLMMGFGIGMGGVGVTLLGPLADSMGVPAALLAVNLLPILAILMVFFVPKEAMRREAEAPPPTEG